MTMRQFALSVARSVVSVLEAEHAPAATPIRLGHVRQYRWRTAVLVWCLWCERSRVRRASLVPSAREMYAASGGMIDWRAWTQITDILRDGNVVCKAPRRTTIWVGGWNYARLRREVRLGQIALPYPDYDPPTAFIAPVTVSDVTGTDQNGRLGQFRGDYN